MESSVENVNIQISEKAASFIKSRRLVNPVVLVNVSFRSSSGEGCGDGCGGGGSSGGGGCDEGKSGPNVAYVNTILVDGGKPGSDFVKVESANDIQVYLARPVYEAASKTKSTLIIGVKGLVMKKLGVEGLDLAALRR